MDNFFVIGDPIAHSLSPIIYNDFAKQMNIQLNFQRKLIQSGEFCHIVEQLRRGGIKGLSVTAPLKQEAFYYVKTLTEQATLAKSVNIVKFDKNNIIGENTDGCGIVKDISKNLGWSFNKKKILILGAGGATRGILASIINEKPCSISILNRTLDKAWKIAKEFTKIQKIDVIDPDDFYHKIPCLFDIIINATSSELIKKLPEYIHKINAQRALCYDLSYSKNLTIFCQWAKEQGCSNCVDGLGMLIEQAAEAFKFWYGLTPSTIPTIKKLRLSLISSSQ